MMASNSLLLDLATDQDANQSLKWHIVSPRARIAGQPCMIGGYIAVPCENGNIELCELKPQGAPAQLPTYRWSGANGLIGESPVLVSDGDKSLVVLTNLGSLRRLKLQTTEAGVLSFGEVGATTRLANTRFFPPDISGQDIIAIDHDGTIHGVHLTDAAVEHWRLPLPARASMPPIISGNAAIVVLESRKIACLDIPSKQLRWVSEPTPGRISAQPVISAEGVLVVDESGHLSILNSADGQVSESRELPPGTGPAASAVPFGKNQFLVPLDDGTLLVLVAPPSKQPEAGR